MLTKDQLVTYKDNLHSLAENINDNDLDLLVEWLKEKDDTVRYAAFLLLQLLSASGDRVYKYWDTFAAMIGDANSYQRSLGLMLIAENIRWDSRDNFSKVYHAYLEHCDDEKFITSRQCIQGLHRIIEHTQKYHREIADTLLAIDLQSKKETQRGLLLMDIVEVLGKLYKEQKEKRIEIYLRNHYEQGTDKVRKKITATAGIK